MSSVVTATVLLPGQILTVPTRPSQGNIAGRGRGEMMSLRSIEGQNSGPVRHTRLGHTLDLNHGKIDPDAANVKTMPHWSDSFTYNGLVYKYTMIGTDPKRGSATTVIPTVLIPLRFVLADGNVFDASTDMINGRTAINGIINSPIFQNYNFNKGSVKVGNTQWGDAYQRANFWDSVSTKSPNYHVLLGQPTVAPTQTINVPAGLSSYFTDPTTGKIFPLVDANFLGSQTDAILTAANVSPTSLPIIVWGLVETIEGDFFSAGYHGVTNLSGNVVQPFIATSYLPDLPFADVCTLAHETVEWMDDPFVNNFTPGWDSPFQTPSAVCDSSPSDILEVADPVENLNESVVPLPGGSFTYHVVEAMFIDFYTRSPRSRSYNGQYSFFEIGLPYGLLTGPSSPCVGHVEFTPTFVDFPGATLTVVMGINNLGVATGVYDDAAGKQHGFLLTNSKYTTVDYPGALATNPFKINDSGMIVGSFIDASGGSHGFSYNKGRWTQIDYPGSSDTEVYGVNSAGKIVGTYNGLQPVAHAFTLENRQYHTISTPFGTQAEAFAINDLGSITGVGYTAPFTGHFTLTLLEDMQYLFLEDAESFFTGPFTTFVQSRNGFSQFQFPGSIVTQAYSINNSNDLAGIFFEPDGATEGAMVTVYNHLYSVNALVFGNDDFDRICGLTYDPNTGLIRGFIGTLPLKNAP